MSSNTGRNDPCPCGSGKKYKTCCGAPKGEVASVRLKDIKDVELTPGLAEALTASLDASYLEYFSAADLPPVFSPRIMRLSPGLGSPTQPS
jgi:hypothetical protein